MSDFGGAVQSVGLGGKLPSSLPCLPSIHYTAPLVLSTGYWEKLCCGATARDMAKHASPLQSALGFFVILEPAYQIQLVNRLMSL